MSVDRNALNSALAEVAARLEQDAPSAEMTEERLVDAAAQCAPSAGDEVLTAAVLASLPAVNYGESQAAYGARIRGEVRR